MAYQSSRRSGRERSRSPTHTSSRHPDSNSYRARSPSDQHHHRRKPTSTSNSVPTTLPFESRELSKRDYEAFKPMFALYLDIQKGKVLEELDEHEAKGRWKSFLGKWNRGELAEGWYDPETLQKAVQSDHPPVKDVRPLTTSPRRRSSPLPSRTDQLGGGESANTRGEESDSDDSVGPALPGQELRSRRNKAGPAIPSLQDLELRGEMEEEDGLAARDDIRYERKLERKAQQAALDELAPRAEAGTRERQLEKKREVNEKMKGFRERSPGAAEVPDAELMGGGESVGDFKRIKQEQERKKTEREIRKEEILRARMAEREERLSEYRAKEDKTMEMLKALAKQRFG